jgi:hypothetical protein
MESGQEISLDQVLDMQEHAGAPHVTVQRVAGNDEVVRVTPWSAGSPCLCGLSLQIPKAAIEAVTLTGQSHSCCGRLLPVVGLRLSDPVWSEVLSQLSTSVSSRLGGGQTFSPMIQDDPGVGDTGGTPRVYVPGGVYCLGGQLYQYVCSHYTGGCYWAALGRPCHLVIPDRPPSSWGPPLPPWY